MGGFKAAADLSAIGYPTTRAEAAKVSETTTAKAFTAAYSTNTDLVMANENGTTNEEFTLFLIFIYHAPPIYSKSPTGLS